MAISGRKFRKPKKGRIRQVVEYAGVYAVLLFVRLVPFRVGRAVGRAPREPCAAVSTFRAARLHSCTAAQLRECL